MAMTIEDYEKDGIVAETLLIERCRKGLDCNLGALPPEGGIVPEVRADLIRLLMLEESSLHPAGLQLAGVRITGTLDLRFATCRGSLTLERCRFDATPQLGRCKIAELSLDGSHFPGLDAQGMEVVGTLFLNNIESIGTIDLVGAHIARQFELTDARISQKKGHALSAQSLHVGTIFMFRDLEKIEGTIDLASAYARDLADDTASWQVSKEVNMVGFTYERISGDAAPTSFEARKGWLEKGSRDKVLFSPQPYTQFAKVMRASGHLGEARKALMERDTILFQEEEKADRKLLAEAWGGTDTQRGDCGKIWCRLHSRRAWAWLSNAVIGHGHMPQRALKKALWAWVFGTLLYFGAYNAGLMVPNSDTILTSEDWKAAVKASQNDPIPKWRLESVASSTHYESFMSAIYALDLFLPITDLGQEKAWRVSTTTPAGAVLRGFSFVYQIAGWVIVSLGIAAVTGFVQRNDPE